MREEEGNRLLGGGVRCVRAVGHGSQAMMDGGGLNSDTAPVGHAIQRRERGAPTSLLLY